MPGEVLVAVAVVLFGWVNRRLGNRHAEQVATTGELLCALAIAEEAVVADAMEALGEDMQQEAADKLVGRDGHDLLATAVPIVLPAETNGAIIDVDEAIVGDGDAVRVAADVIEDLLGSGEGRLGVDHPRGFS